MHWLPFINFFSFIVFFLIGNVGFVVYTKQGNTLLNKLMLAGLIVFSFCSYGLTAAFISLLAILFILFYKKSVSKRVLLTGKISYSVYLLHYPIGVKFLILPFPILQQQSVWTLFIVALLMILVLSYFFYKWIKVPSEKLAFKFMYRQEQALFTMPQLI
jgi:peptidoglycan/LPS O-acetylase OafA/YrhL